MVDEEAPTRGRGEAAGGAGERDGNASFPVPEQFTLVRERYRVLAEIGSGGMGVVLHARDEMLHRDIALKLIRRDGGFTDDGRTRMLTEARAMASVRHVNIVQVFDMGEYKGAPYIAMEYIEGHDLHDWLMKKDDRVLAIDEAIGVLDQMCRGVTALHDAGIIHQDLKPANVLIAQDFRVAITDFGLVRLLQNNDDNQTIIGTPPFTAPEVVAGKRVDQELAGRVDVYALGAIAYQLLTGCYMFPIDDTRRLFRLQTESDPVPPSHVREELPPAFDEVILSALTRDPVKRTRTAEAFRRDLQGAREVTQTRAMLPALAVVVDDDAAFRRFLKAALRGIAPGLEVLEAADGHEGFELTKRYRPALVITDLEMPGMNGIELTAAIRGNASTEDVPIIVTTAVGGAAEWRMLAALDADAYLIKPIPTETLAVNVNRFLRKNRP